jgi:hypothetical protein
MPKLTIRMNDYFKVTGQFNVTPRGVKEYLRKTVIGGKPRDITKIVSGPSEIVVEYSASQT